MKLITFSSSRFKTSHIIQEYCDISVRLFFLLGMKKYKYDSYCLTLEKTRLLDFVKFLLKMSAATLLNQKLNCYDLSTSC